MASSSSIQHNDNNSDNNIMRKRLILPILSRREEEQQIRDAWDYIHEGVRVVFLVGKSGTGKTTAVTQALHAAKAGSGARFQSLQASTKFDQKRACAPLKGLRQLVSSLVVAATRTCGRTLRDKLSHEQYKTLQSFMMPMQRQNTQRMLFSSSPSKRRFSAPRRFSAFLKQYTAQELSDSDGDSIASNEDHEDHERTETTEDLDDASIRSRNNEVNKDSRTLLTTTLRATLRAISSVSSVILTLDDLHWSCKTTMEVLQKIVTDPQLKNVLVCATFRTDEPTATEGFYEWADELPMNLTVPAEAHTINFDNLQLTAVQELLAEALNKDDVAGLAETVFNFTHGNLFFIKHFMERLQEDDLLTFDMFRHQWVWDVRDIQRQGSLTDNVVQILAARIHKLSKPVQNVLLLASCSGNQFDVRALEATKSALGVDSAYQRIAQAEEHELVMSINSAEGGTHYKFAHDMIQMAAWGMFPEGTDMAQIHWDIGCLLMQEEELLQCDCILFSTVDHLNMKGPNINAEPDLNHNGDEASLRFQLDNVNIRIQLAHLNYRAGCQASALSAFGPAARYIQAGIASLGDRPFECSYDLAYKLFTMAAKTECVGGNLDASQEAAQQVLDHAKTYEEKLPLVSILFNCYQARSNPPKLLEFALATLQQLGENVEENPSKVKVEWEYRKMRFHAKRLSDEKILKLPPMTDYKKETILQIMYKLIFPLYQMEKQRLCTYLTCRMVSITLKHGLSKSLAPHFFVMAATCIISQNQDIEEGYRLGRLAEKVIAKQGGVDPNYGTVLCYLGHLNKWWKEPVHYSLEKFIECNQLSMKSGNVSNAFQSTVGYAVNYFYSGLPLGPLLQDMELFGKLYLEYNQIMFFLLASPLWQCLLNLTGKSADPSTMETGTVMERRKAFPAHKKCGVQSIHSFQMIISYYRGDLEKATEMSEKLADCKPGIMGASFWYASRLYHVALIAIANCRKSPTRKGRQEAEKQVKHFKKLVKKGAINLLHKLQLLQAELMTVDVNPNKPKEVDAVMAMYDSAIVSATRAGFLQDAALANYLCFQFCDTHKVRIHLRELYLKRSVEHWIDWGGFDVADSILERHGGDYQSTCVSVREMKDSSCLNMSNSLRGRSRFDDALAMQHKELRVSAQ
ncbi:Protein tyrosine kinase [Seminavis robusta]|uniref:Protein tyrosine kinase n=1 Tax=Seminavis robusta TaxID=568900 RepID=A0A9N8DHB8_9STRA|nr:Protein tyrosine kinase [Seminavis robusta]|eukprot:Sro91_g047600.1 Protein tyrosine kinase (1139) ;mRNA; r:29323-32819